MQDVITQKLETAFQPKLLEVKDTSDLHKNHREAPKGGNSHFSVLIVSREFIGLPLLQRHRRVYEVLEKELKKSIHALAVKSYTPQEWRTHLEIAAEKPC